MDNCMVPNGDSCPNGERETRVGVQHSPFLDVRPVSDVNQFVVTPQNGTEPDADIATEPNAADDVSARSNPDLISVREFRHRVTECVNRHLLLFLSSLAV
jgi:hypothetical protein